MQLDSVVVSVSAGRPASEQISASIEVVGSAIGEGDIARVLAAGSRHSARPGRAVLHSLPIGYVLDQARGIQDPRGMLALTPLRRVYHRLRNRPAQAVSYLYFPRRIDRLARQAGLRPVARRTIGFGPLSFMGRPLVGEQRAVRINDRLQALADAGFPGLRWSGWHYLLRAHKDEPGDLQSP